MKPYGATGGVGEREVPGIAIIMRFFPAVRVFTHHSHMSAPIVHIAAPKTTANDGVDMLSTHPEIRRDGCSAICRTSGVCCVWASCCWLAKLLLLMVVLSLFLLLLAVVTVALVVQDTQIEILRWCESCGREV